MDAALVGHDIHELRVQRKGDTCVCKQCVVDSLENFCPNTHALGRNRAARLAQRVKNLLPHPASQEIDAIGELHEGGDHPRRAHASEAIVCIHQPDRSTLPGSRKSRRNASVSAANHQHIRLIAHVQFAAIRQC